MLLMWYNSAFEILRAHFLLTIWQNLALYCLGWFRIMPLWKVAVRMNMSFPSYTLQPKRLETLFVDVRLDTIRSETCLWCWNHLFFHPITWSKLKICSSECGFDALYTVMRSKILNYEILLWASIMNSLDTLFMGNFTFFTFFIPRFPCFFLCFFEYHTVFLIKIAVPP